MSMPILELRDVEKSFGGLMAIHDLSLTVNEGELRCVIGPNGAGKTTLFNLISGALRPDEGEVLFQGQRLHGVSVMQRSRLGIGRKFQSPNIFANLTVEDNLRVAARGTQPIAGLLRSTRVASLEAKIEEILALILLDEKRNHVGLTLSHGEKQWLEIGMVLVNGPKLMLLDEPTAGMTPAETYQTSQLINDIAEETTTIVIEHDLKFIREIANIVTVLHYGTVLTTGPVDEIAQNEEVREAYLGTKEL